MSVSEKVDDTAAEHLISQAISRDSSIVEWSGDIITIINDMSKSYSWLSPASQLAETTIKGESASQFLTCV